MTATLTPLDPPFAASCEVGPPPRPSESGLPVSPVRRNLHDPSRGPYAQTLTGGYWYMFTPRPEDVRFADLRALARVNRFGGHTVVDCYSVAEHSVRVAHRILSLGGTRAQALAGLTHDAHEAYPPGDQLGPFLRAMKSEEACALLDLMPFSFAGLLSVVRLAESTVREALGVTDSFAHWQTAALVKRADMELLATERRDLMADGPVEWGGLRDPLPGRIVPWTPVHAWAEFQGTWEDLGGRLR